MYYNELGIVLILTCNLFTIHVYIYTTTINVIYLFEPVENHILHIIYMILKQVWYVYKRTL